MGKSYKKYIHFNSNNMDSHLGEIAYKDKNITEIIV
jgi:hypothetical protein